MTPASELGVISDDGTALPVWRHGSGRPLLLVHGSGEDHRAWDRVLPLLTGREVWTFDRRSTFLDPAISYPLEREFEDVLSLMREAGGEVDVVGASSGGVCALGAALRSSNLGRLVLYEPPQLDSHAAAVLERLQNLLRQGDNEAVAEAFLREAVKLAPAAVETIKASRSWPRMVERAPYTVREFAALQAWRPPVEQLDALEGRVLVLVGGDTPQDHHHRGYARLLATHLRQVAVRELDGQEHAAHRVAPEAFAQACLDFLEAAGQSTTSSKAAET